MPIAPEKIDEYFKQYGWRYTKIDDNNWETGFRGDVATYRIRIRSVERWIYFTIVPFAVAPKKECWPRLHYYLLRANQDMNVAKFYVDGDNDVVLAVELPVDDLDYSEFERSLNALSYYADDHYLNVLNLAQNAHAPSKYEQAPAAEGEQQAGQAQPAGDGGTPGSSGGGDLDWGDESTPAPGNSGS